MPKTKGERIVEMLKGLIQPVVVLGGFFIISYLALAGTFPANDYLQFFLMFAGMYAGQRAVKGADPTKS